MNYEGLSTLLTVILSLAFGIINCFYGYRLLRLILALWGFVIGAVIGVAITGGDNITLALVIALIGGALGVLVMNMLYTVGVVALGALFGIFAAALALAAVGMEPHIVVSVIMALVFGALAAIFTRFVIIVATAFTGSWGIVSAILLLAGGDPFSPLITSPATGPSLEVVALIIWLVIGLSGVIVQYRASR